MAIAFLLGGLLEKYLVQALSISRGDWGTFVQRPISVAFLIIIVINLAVVLRSYFRGRAEKSNSELAAG